MSPPPLHRPSSIQQGGLMLSIDARPVALAVALMAALAVCWPAAAQDPPTATQESGAGIPHELPATAPPAPQPQAGETQIPPVGTAAEDDQPRSQAERSAALEHLRAVTACVR